MLCLLDTDHLSLLERGGPEGTAIRSRLQVLAPDDYGITVVSYAEQTRGWLAEVARANSPQAEVRAFASLIQNYRYCGAFAIWEYTPEAAGICAALRKQRLRVGTQDMRIAAIALYNNATLLTRNRSDFERIPGLRFEDWSK